MTAKQYIKEWRQLNRGNGGIMETVSGGSNSTVIKNTGAKSNSAPQTTQDIANGYLNSFNTGAMSVEDVYNLTHGSNADITSGAKIAYNSIMADQISSAVTSAFANYGAPPPQAAITAAQQYFASDAGGFGTDPSGLAKYVTNLSDNPSAFIGQTGVKALSDAQTAQQTSKYNTDLAQGQATAQGANSPETQLLNQNQQNLNTQFGQQQNLSTQLLLNQLAARGISTTGDSGATAGGMAKIASDIAQQQTAGQGQLLSEYDTAVGNAAQNYANTALGLGQANLNTGEQDIATQLANAYQQNMASQYSQNMQNLTPSSLGSTLGSIAGAGLSAATGGAVPLTGATNAGNAIGSLLQKLISGRN